MFMKLAIDAIPAEGGIMRESVLEKSFKAYWSCSDSQASATELDSIWKLTRMMFGCRAGLIVAASNGYRFLDDVIHWHLAADNLVDTLDLENLEEVKSTPVFAVLSMMMLVKLSITEDQYAFEISIANSFVKRLGESSGEDRKSMVEILSDLIWDTYGNSHVTSQLLRSGPHVEDHRLLQQTVLEAYLANVAEVPDALAQTRIYKSHKDFAEELIKKKS
jgi:hypothetical protein